MDAQPSQLARRLLSCEMDSLVDVRIYQFQNRADARDDDLQRKLEAEFNADFEHLEAQLVEEFGSPSRAGTVADDAIPLCGVFRFAVWDVHGKQLFVVEGNRGGA
jgi:hypothetical protein